MPRQQASVPQAKLIRLLKLIAQLRKQPATIHEIARQYEVSVRTAYRYIQIFELCDFVVDQDFNNRFFIA